MCDLAHLIWVERRERQALADRQGLIASGMREGLPEVGAQLEEFERLLAEEPAVSRLDADEIELRRALGVL